MLVVVVGSVVVVASSAADPLQAAPSKIKPANSADPSGLVRCVMPQ
jgi:hypothetical protein